MQRRAYQLAGEDGEVSRSVNVLANIYAGFQWQQSLAMDRPLRSFTRARSTATMSAALLALAPFNRDVCSIV